MTSLVAELLQDPALPEAVAVLQDSLTAERARRERFYEEVTDDVKAEFINGEVIMHSPAMARQTSARLRLTKLLDTYVSLHRLGLVHDEKSLCVFPRNDYEPDVVFFSREKAALIQPTTLKFPIPDFVCEVLSESTEARDRGVKYRDFEVHGVGEYWLVDAETELIEQYLPRGSRYELALKSGSGEIVSTVVQGFRIPVRALFDDAENLRALRSVLA
jgi:Uma2 family endonuclease